MRTLLDERLAGLVHGSASAAARPLHERFLVSRLATGAVMMALLPPCLAWRGVPTGLEALAVASLLLPVLAAVLLARTGSLWLAHAVSAAGLAGLVACLAGLTGGAASPAAVWFVAVPLEAAASGSRRATVAAALSAVFGVLAVAAGPWGDPLSAVLAVPAWVALPAFAITAIGHAVAQALRPPRAAGAAPAPRPAEAGARDRRLLAAIDDLVTWHDANGRVLEASDAASRLVGVEAPALRGHGLLERVHVADRPAYLKAVSDVAAGGRPATLTLRLHAARADGARLIHAEMRAHRLAGADECAEGVVVAVTRDVSEHRARAEALERARAEAERADAVKVRFLANVTHELRTPLNAIIGFSEVLAGEGAVALGPEQARDYAAIIGASGHHLLGVVNTLLDMSRIQSGNFDYAPEAFDAADLVRTACDLMRLRAEAAGVALIVCAPRPAEIAADPRACRQVVLNLVANAVRFTPRGGRVDVSLRRGPDGLTLTVADTGQGVAEADLGKLGTPFFQAGASGYARAHEGTGLGLSVVQGLVGLHGGAIRIESAPGAGTAVTVTLPLDCRAPAQGMGAGTAPAPIQTAVRGALPPRPAVVRLPLGLFDAEPAPAARAASDITGAPVGITPVGITPGGPLRRAG